MSQRDPYGIVIHHSASNPATTTRETIYQWHVVSRGWDDIGYHFICLPSGQIVPGRPFANRGAHAGPGGNAFTGICVVGYNGSEDHLDWKWNGIQIRSVQRWLNDYRGIFENAWFKGHREIKPTLCPGLDVHEVFS